MPYLRVTVIFAHRVKHTFIETKLKSSEKLYLHSPFSSYTEVVEAFKKETSMTKSSGKRSFLLHMLDFNKLCNCRTCARNARQAFKHS